MGQIVKRKKKGRPSKADLARRLSESVVKSPGSDIRRSHRRRNMKYSIDIDDYIDEDDDDDEEELRRREKKLKLVVKLNHSELVPSRARSCRVHAPSCSDEEDEYDKRRTVKKKVLINGDDGGEEDEVDECEEMQEKEYSRGTASIPGTPTEPPSQTLLPDKKTLELILDKLQKKDIYGVYAEPVDPEELPDYHDVIEHPMDFATTRKKLADGSYSTLEQFQSDVFLICSNAMQYNSADTIYYKQARTIQELAKKKFERLRFDIERSEGELISEQKERSNNQIKKTLCGTSQEPIGSDFSSGATLATATTANIQNGSIQAKIGISERPSIADGTDEGFPLPNDSNLEKADEVIYGKDPLPKFGRKPAMLDENRRTTYNHPKQPTLGSESIFSTFEGEIKQLVAVGLHAEYSYGRSLARFAATLGPVAWKVASLRIEQALPAGSKFGRGWVGEYEPLPTPVLLLENCTQKESSLATKLKYSAGLRKDGKSFSTSVPSKGSLSPTSEQKPSLFVSTSRLILEGKRPLHVSAGPISNSPVSPICQPQNLLSWNNVEPQKRVLKKIELNSPSSASQNNVGLITDEKPSTNVKNFQPKERSTNIMHSVPFKHPDANGTGSARLPNRNINGSNWNDNMIRPSSDSVSNQMLRGGTIYACGQEQGLGGPVQVMQMLAEKAQYQQKSSNHSSGDTVQVAPSVPSVRGDATNNAAAAAARAWMSIGAGGFEQLTETSCAQNNQISADSLYNASREFRLQGSRVRPEFSHPGGLPFQQADKTGFPCPMLVQQPMRPGIETQFQNRPMSSPQLVATDLSRFQVQSPWRGFSPQSQPRHRQEMFPPDLNIGFQPPVSPVKQTSSVLVESQQPDLALQL